MPQTITSTNTGYCSPGEMLLHFDRRLIGMLISDTGVPVTDDFALLNNNVLKTALMQASAEVESACYRGGRYSKDDLDAIYASDTAAKRFLTWLVASIALYRLWQRRGDPKVIVGDFTSALQYLEALETGKRIFPLAETAVAGRKLEFVDASGIPDANDLVIKYRRILGNVGLPGNLGLD
jgi:phage gp36-like protein